MSVENPSFKIQILTLNVLSENYVDKSNYKNYKYQDRYLYLVNWLNSKITDQKSKPDIILLQEFDQELWTEFKKKSESSKTSSTLSMFDDFLFIFTFFDKEKVGFFKESIIEILKKAGIHQVNTLNFFSGVVHPGMVIGINIKKFMILPSCEPEFIPEEHLDINKLFTVDYLRRENSYNINQLVYTIWPFQNLNLFLNNLFSRIKGGEKDDLFRFNPLRFCQSICLILKSNNIPIILSNVSLEKNEKEMAIAQLNYLYEYNNHIKKQFIVEPNIILVGNIRFSSFDLSDSKMLPPDLKLNLKFTEPELLLKGHHDYIITSPQIDDPTFKEHYPSFKDKRTKYPNFEKEFIVINKTEKSAILNLKDNWPSDHEALLIELELFNSTVKIDKSIRLSDINEKTNHLFDPLFEENIDYSNQYPQSTSYHPYINYQDNNLRTLSQPISRPPPSSKEIRKKLDQHDKFENEHKKKQAQEMIKEALAKKKRINTSEGYYNQSVEQNPNSGLIMNQSSSKHEDNINNNNLEYQPALDEMNYLEQPQQSPPLEMAYFQQQAPQSHPQPSEMDHLQQPQYQPKYQNRLNSLGNQISPPEFMNANNNVSNVPKSSYLDVSKFTSRPKIDNSLMSKSHSLSQELNREFSNLENLEPPKIESLNPRSYLSGLEVGDNSSLEHRSPQHYQYGGNMDSSNNQEVNEALQLLINNIGKVKELRKDIDNIYSYTSKPGTKFKNKGGKSIKKKVKKNFKKSKKVKEKNKKK